MRVEEGGGRDGGGGGGGGREGRLHVHPLHFPRPPLVVVHSSSEKRDEMNKRKCYAKTRNKSQNCASHNWCLDLSKHSTLTKPIEVHDTSRINPFNSALRDCLFVGWLLNVPATG